MEFIGLSRAPEACTLPTVEQPLRVDEFNRVLAAAASGVERVSPEQLRITLRPAPDLAAAAASLAVRETRCCSFFTFTLTASADRLRLDVTVPAGQAGVLDALAQSA